MNNTRLYIGTYTTGFGPETPAKTGEGIYTYAIDMKTGKLTLESLCSEGIVNPSFLTIDGDFLYATNELLDKGRLVAYRIDSATGALSLLGGVDTPGSAMCHVAVWPKGGYLTGSNYMAGSFVTCPIKEDGSLAAHCDVWQDEGSGPNAERQEGPHAHSCTPDAAGNYLFGADLGTDRIMCFKPDQETGKLLENPAQPFVAVTPGLGPRHFTFHPSGRYAYLVTELAAKVVVYDYDAQNGTLAEKQVIDALPEGGPDAPWAADIHLSPDGRFLYSSNRIGSTISVFKVEAATGMLSFAGQYGTKGETPRNFCIDPYGKFLIAANQDSGNVVVFRRNAETGALEEVLDEVEVPMAVCIQFDER